MKRSSGQGFQDHRLGDKPLLKREVM
jgi:hypothetical protein